MTLDRCQIVNDEDNSDSPSKLLITFTIPDELLNKEILLAEFTTSFTYRNRLGDSLLELRFYPLLSALPEGDVDYQALGAVSDSMTAGSWTTTFGSEAGFHVYITDFLQEVVMGERNNFGLVGTLDLLGDANVVLPENLGEAIRNHAVLRVIYK
jgi:hypothetical protein